MRKLLVSIFLLSFCFGTASAEDAAQFDKIKARITEELGQAPASIAPAPIKGLYEVVIGPEVYYMTQYARYIFRGDLLDMQTKANLTDAKRDGARLAALDAVGEKNMIIFAPKETKHTITVFTDIDCGYCRKLHNEMAEYNKLGIKVRYMAYPRAGIPSDSYNKAVSVWCADDPKKAMTAAKTSGTVVAKTCDNPVAKEFELGQALGVNGTPALVLENGKIYPGYAPPKQLSDLLDKIKSGKS